MPPTENPRAKPVAARRADYGIDAPGVVRTFCLLGAAFLVLAGGLVLALHHGIFLVAKYVIWPFVTMGLFFLAQGGMMVWASLWGKLALRDDVLAGIPWRGDETVLDVGCGHGLMLIGAAKRLNTGKAVGVDLWQKEDQAGN